MQALLKHNIFEPTAQLIYGRLRMLLPANYTSLPHLSTPLQSEVLDLMSILAWT